eukprot:scaffold4427_cov417-Prasinococcus_capsulatus_cf.AAC.5
MGRLCGGLPAAFTHRVAKARRRLPGGRPARSSWGAPAPSRGQPPRATAWQFRGPPRWMDGWMDPIGGALRRRYAPCAPRGRMVRMRFAAAGDASPAAARLLRGEGAEGEMSGCSGGATGFPARARHARTEPRGRAGARC